MQNVHKDGNHSGGLGRPCANRTVGEKKTDALQIFSFWEKKRGLFPELTCEKGQRLEAGESETLKSLHLFLREKHGIKINPSIA